MSLLWIAVIAASVLSFVQKWIGYQARPMLNGRARITTMPLIVRRCSGRRAVRDQRSELAADARLPLWRSRRCWSGGCPSWWW